MEPEEGVEKISDALKTCNTYKTSYYSHKEQLNTYFKDGDTVVEWQFEGDLIFSRVNKLISRLELINVSNHGN